MPGRRVRAQRVPSPKASISFSSEAANASISRGVSAGLDRRIDRREGPAHLRERLAAGRGDLELPRPAVVRVRRLPQKAQALETPDHRRHRGFAEPEAAGDLLLRRSLAGDEHREHPGLRRRELRGLGDAPVGLLLQQMGGELEAVEETGSTRRHPSNILQ